MLVYHGRSFARVCLSVLFVHVYALGVDCVIRLWLRVFFFLQAEDGIRDLVRSRGLGDVYKRQGAHRGRVPRRPGRTRHRLGSHPTTRAAQGHPVFTCLLYTSDAADERSSVDLGGRRIIKKKTDNT